MAVSKKVLYLITKSNWGGAQRYVFDMAMAAKAAGYDVVVAYGGNGTLAERLRATGVRGITVEGLGRDVGSSDWRAYRAIARIIKIEQPEVLHLNSSKAGAFGALAGRFAGVPRIIYTSHGWAFNEKRNFMSRAAIWLVSWCTALCSHKVICVSNAELRAAKHMPFCAHKAVLIYNGIDLQMHFGSGEKIRSAFPAGAHITGTVGELTRNKNQVALLEQAKHNSDMYVAIVGEGELRPMLEAKIKEYGLQTRVKLFGFMPAADVLKGFDTFALPSTKEALGYVLLEARAAGLPIVANRVGGVSEALDRPLADFALEKMVEQTAALY